MSEAVMNRSRAKLRLGRSIFAILAGIIPSILVTLGTDEILHLTHVYPPWGASMVGHEWTLLLATIYRTVYGVAGAYLTARLAPSRPMQHVWILGFLGLAANIAGAAATWNGGPAFGPHWYPIALVVLALPTAWAGGKIRLAQETAAPE